MVPTKWRTVSIGSFRICIVGIIHLVWVAYGLWMLVDDEKYLEQNSYQKEQETRLSIGLYSIHLAFILSLFISVYKKYTPLLLPWLMVTTVLFSYVSLMVLTGLRHMKSYLIFELLVNLGCTGICWYIWSLVYRTFKTGYLTRGPIYRVFWTP
ncbi:hypothetical protein JTB14_014517 [Gonioctena quinquepunctata]|nr:hypothetical protein JTB14_014517 [Gonioctena quinquepunctata]